MPPSFERTMDSLAKSSPKDLIMLLIIGAFLWYTHSMASEFTGYLKYKEEKVDLVAKQRIETCHSIQMESVEASKELSATLRSQEKAFNELVYQLKHGRTVRE